ncbi:nucleolar protein dao-5-like isoform X2 [Embiotoca jacksoni]|uniref:nucleolar protein dao-5-like isoform X2 n=1 Tax=Embiotoca jacksoni TaxID=100190 RepID=UPI003704C40B
MTRRCFLACHMFTFCLALHSLGLVAGQTIEYALVGQTVKFSASLRKSPSDILWKHDGDKAIDFNGNEEHVYNPYENRVTLDWQSADLEITDLKYEDSGNYVLEVYTNNIFETLNYKLEVMDKVATPTISCEMNNDESGNQATLTCSAEPSRPQSSMKFEWRSHGNVKPGQNLTISLGKEHDDELHNCTVSNRLTKDSAAFTAKDCYTGQSSIALIVSLCIVFLIAIAILLAGIMYLKTRHKACFNVEEPKEEGNRRSVDEPLLRNGVKELKAVFEKNQSGKESDQVPLDETQQKGVKELKAVFEKNQSGKESDQVPLDETQQKGVKELKAVFEKNQSGEEKIRDGVKKNASPPPVPKKPLFTPNFAGNDKGDELSEPMEEKVSESHPSDSEKENDVLPAALDDQNEDTRTDLQSPTASENSEKIRDSIKKNASPPPVSKKPLSPPNFAGNDKGDELSKPMEEKVSESHPSDSEKENDVLPAALDDQNEDTRTDLQSPTASENPEKIRDGVKKNASPPPVPKKPLSPPNLAGNDKGDELSEPMEEKVSESHPSDSEKENDVLPAALDDQNEDTRTDLKSSTASENPEKIRDGVKKNASPPPVSKKPLSPLNFAGNDKGDELSEPMEEKVSESHPSDSEKENDVLPAALDDQNEDTRTDLQSSTASENPEKIRDSIKKNASPPPVPKKPLSSPNFAGNDKGDELSKPMEEKVSESHPSDSEKENDVLLAALDDQNEDTRTDLQSPTASENPEKIRDGVKKNGCRPPVPKKPLSPPNFAGNDKGDELSEPMEEKVSESHPSDSEKENDVLPAALDDQSEDTD